MKIIYLFVCLLFLFGNRALGKHNLPDIDALLDLKDYEGSPLYDSLAYAVWRVDSETALTNIKKVRDVAVRKNRVLWVLEMDFLEGALYSNRGLGADSIVLQKLLNVEKRANAMGEVYIEARALFMLFRKHWNVGDYRRAMEDVTKLDYLLKSFSERDLKSRESYLYWMGEAYYFFHDYSTALEYFKRVLAMPDMPHNEFAKMQSLNTIGLIFQANNELDSSDYYFELVRDFCASRNRPHCEGMAQGNLGMNCFLRGDFERAIPLLKQDVETALAHKDFGLASGSGTVLANIYLQLNQLADAKFYMDTTFSNIALSGQSYRLRLLYPIMAKYQMLIGNPEAAREFLDSADVYERFYNRSFNSMIVLHLHQRDYMMNITELQTEQRRKKVTRRVELFSMGAAAILFGFGFYWTRLNEKTKKQLSNVAIQKKTQAYEDARIQLEFFANKLIQNEELIQSLSKRSLPNQHDVSLEELKKSRILTDDDWVFFRERFEKVHCGFIHHLTTRYSDLTPSEIRYLSLVKLNLSKNEISTALGISSNSLRVTWYRIRKKLALDSDISPEDLIKKIDENRS